MDLSDCCVGRIGRGLYRPLQYRTVIVIAAITVRTRRIQRLAIVRVLRWRQRAGWGDLCDPTIKLALGALCLDRARDQRWLRDDYFVYGCDGRDQWTATRERSDYLGHGVGFHRHGRFHTPSRGQSVLVQSRALRLRTREERPSLLPWRDNGIYRYWNGRERRSGLFDRHTNPVAPAIAHTANHARRSLESSSRPTNLLHPH